MISRESWRLMRFWVRLTHAMRLSPFKLDPKGEASLAPARLLLREERTLHVVVLFVHAAVHFWCLESCVASLLSQGLGWTIETIIVVFIGMCQAAILGCEALLAFSGPELARMISNLYAFNQTQIQIHKVSPDAKDGMELYFRLSSSCYLLLPFLLPPMIYFVIAEFPGYHHLDMGSVSGNIAFSVFSAVWFFAGTGPACIVIGPMMTACNSLPYWMGRAVWNPSTDLALRRQSLHSYRQIQLLLTEILHLFRIHGPFVITVDSIVFIFGLVGLISPTVGSWKVKGILGYVALVTASGTGMGIRYCGHLAQKSREFRQNCKETAAAAAAGVGGLPAWENKYVVSIPPLKVTFGLLTLDDEFFLSWLDTCANQLIALLLTAR